MPSAKEVFLDRIARARMLDVHRPRLAARQEALRERLAALDAQAWRRILLVNAVKGQQFYPSVTDFFALMRKAHPHVEVTSLSYSDAHELEAASAAKGLEVRTLRDVSARGPEWLDAFDLVLFVGPSTLMSRAMSSRGVTARLVCLDLAFYHQLIDLDAAAFFERRSLWPRAPACNEVAIYSCQSREKVADDIGHSFDLGAFRWSWFNYIPIGFDHVRFYESGAKLFDVALLGASSRDYALVDPARLAGRKVLALPGTNHIPLLAELAPRCDLFVAPRVHEDVYARLLALTRCVLLPIRAGTPNVFLSVADALAAGQLLVTSRHPGLARLVAEGLPALLYEAGDASDMFRQLEVALAGGPEVDALRRRGPTFAAERLDIHDVLLRIVRECRPRA